MMVASLVGSCYFHFIGVSFSFGIVFKGKRKDLHGTCRSKDLVGTRSYPLLLFRALFVFSPPFAQSFRYSYPVVVHFACSSTGFIFGRRKKTHADIRTRLCPLCDSNIGNPIYPQGRRDSLGASYLFRCAPHGVSHQNSDGR